MALQIRNLLNIVFFVALTSSTSAIQSKRTFAGGRGLRATPYGPASKKFPPFANKGGPPDVTGVWSGDRYIGILPPGDGFASTVYLEDGTFQQQMGRYESWECTAEPGVYIATAVREDTYSNGTIEYRERCEVGKVLAEGVYYWKSSADQCPEPNDSSFNTPLYRVKNSTSIPGVFTLYCTGNAGAGFTNVGKSGLDAKRPVGVTSGSPLPPPLDPNAPFPPVFAQSSGPTDLIGIWYSDESRTGELIAPDGSFSSVAYTLDGTFKETLGRFNSYNCTGPGAYVGSISFTQTSQDLKKVSSVGCTSGSVDLKADTYTWSPASRDNTCPDENSPKFTLDRVNSSMALPTPTSLTCT